MIKKLYTLYKRIDKWINKSKKNRIKCINYGLIICIGFLTLRLSYIMIAKAPEYSQMAEEQWTSEVKIDAVRGKILDRNGAELAISENVYRVDFDLESIRSYMKTTLENLGKDEREYREKAGIKLPTKEKGITTDDIAPIIAEVLGMETKEIKDKLELQINGTPAKATTVKRKVKKDVADKIKDLHIYGIVISADTERYYPNNNFLSHVLGFTGNDNKGLYGVELQYNSYLEGTPGMKIGQLSKNSTDLPYAASQYSAPIHGKDVKLTIDEVIQSFAEKAANDAYANNNNPKAVSVVVMNPKTGEILAMVNKPDFNPNKPYSGYENFEGKTESEKIQKMWRNRLVNDTFEPGSIFKVITAITGMEENVVNANTDFYCGGGLFIDGRNPKCWVTQGHGAQKFPDIIKNSCNVGFMTLGSKIGKEKLTESIKKFGFGEYTKIDLPGEAQGILKDVKDMKDIDLATISFGQTNTLNAMQYMAAFNAVANGGTWIQPHVMKEITHEDEDMNTIVDEVFKSDTRTVASSDNCAELRRYLERVITEGSGVNTFIEGYHIAGKTGTAEKVINNGYGEDGKKKYIATFVGMAPVDDPEITVMVSVDEPNPEAYYASEAAVPYAKPLFISIFNYLNTQFQTENIKRIEKEVIVPEIRGLNINEAKKVLDDIKLKYDIIGDGKKISSMATYPGFTVKEGSKIKLYTDNNADYNSNDVAMPDVKGYSKEEASELLNKLGISSIFEGSGAISAQDIVPHEIIPKGTCVKLTLSSNYKD